MKRLLNKLFRLKGWAVVSRDDYGYNINQDLIRWLAPTKRHVIFDVGANVGQSMRQFAKQFPHSSIYSFEPIRTSFDELQRHAAGRRNVSVFNCALGTTDGHHEMFRFKAGETNSLLNRTDDSEQFTTCQDDLEPRGRELIRIQRLDTFVNQNGITRIDFLKIDTQGYDLEVLKGAGAYLTPKNIGVIRMEIMFAPVYEHQCGVADVLPFLESKGFKFMGFYDAARHRKENYITQYDAVFHGNI